MYTYVSGRHMVYYTGLSNVIFFLSALKKRSSVICKFVSGAGSNNPRRDGRRQFTRIYNYYKIQIV